MISSRKRRTEQNPWIGEALGSLNHLRVGIVGFSHWDYDDDIDSVTVNVLGGMFGAKSTHYFSSIRSYFGFRWNADFWRRVAFFNYMPNCIGGENHHDAIGTPEEYKQAEFRFLRTIKKHKLDKTFVFNVKAASQLPETIEQCQGRTLKTLQGVTPDEFPWGTYQCCEHVAQVFMLRHPKGAYSQSMKQVVRQALEIPMRTQ